MKHIENCIDKAQEEARLQMKLQEIKQEKKAAKANYKEIQEKAKNTSHIR